MSKPAVLITGANRGIGLALARAYVGKGYDVYATARQTDKATEVSILPNTLVNQELTFLCKLKSVGVKKIIPLEVDKPTSIAELSTHLDKNVPIQLLINNSGILKPGSLQTATARSLQDQFAVNALGPFLVSQALLANLRKSSSSGAATKIVHIGAILGSLTTASKWASISAKFGGMHGYNASKAALNMLTQSMAFELKKDNIAVLSIHPGMVKTDMTGKTGQLTAEDSVKHIVQVIDSKGISDSGKFLNYTGEALPW
jgi:NAD(P)-dependent dehydrogenase (short-subunit alcohol dehydrogenase family)